MSAGSVRRLRLFLLAAFAVLAFGASPAWAISPNLVISQIYGGGGNTGAPFTHDYIEIFNRGTGIVFLSGLSLQYTSATGTGNFGATSTQITEFVGGALAPGQYLLVQEGAGAGNGVPLSPAPDVVDGTPIAMSATGGKVAIVTGTTSLGCNGGSTPCDAAQLARIIDLIGYDGANFFEGAAPAPTLSNTTAAFRMLDGCQDTDNNAADFFAGAPAPRNAFSPLHFCDGDAAPFISARSPADGATGVPLNSDVTITFSEPVNVSGTWYSISCGSSGLHTATVSGGPTTFTLNPDTDFATGETCTVTVFGGQVSDQDTIDPPDNVAGNPTWSFTTVAPAVEIHDIQGAGHNSPFLGMPVSSVTGVVTAKRSNGFYLQDPTPDADDATSEGIFVFTSSSPSMVNVGDAVSVNGTVAEFRPGGSSSTNLRLTEITGPSITVLSSGNPLPAPIAIGTSGRVPPTEVIENDAAGSVETSGVFDPANDGIDFYESLEAMRVQIDDPVVVGPRNSFGEVWVLANQGAYAGIGVRTARNGIVIRDLGPEPPGDYQSGDFNPERIQLDDALLAGSTPNVHVGDGFTTAAVGVLDYDFGNFEVNLTSALTRVDNGLAREVTADPAAKELAVATFNVENLDANEPQSKFDALAGQIVNNMRSPDVVSLEEIQDNNGATNDSVVDASQTLTKLVNAISAAGGPTYDFRQIDPVDDQDGGEPGGNIRVGFIFRTDRGLAFVDRPGGGSTTPTTIVSGPNGPELSSSPGRVDPTNPAWNASRKPLAGEFTFRGETFFLITNHFNSKGGDHPLFGRFQPPVRSSETQRHQQAQIVNDFADSIFALDSNANVVVLGDINDFGFSQTMSILEGGVLHNLIDTLPQDERYSYVFEGNSQTLDNIVISNSLFTSPFAYDAVHVNAEFHDQLSDHDPQVARFFVNTAPSADAGGPYTVAEGGSVGVSATGTDANGDALTYTWDLDNDGTFETSGQNATFSAAALDGPSTHTIAVRVSDGSASTTDTATVNVTNVAPSATFNAPATAFAGFAFTISLTNPSDPSAADTAAGFEYAFDCGDGSGYGVFGSASSASCPTTTTGTRTVRGKIRDKDGGVREYTATVQVVVTFESLCALVRAYSSDPQVADVLCNKLDLASRAPRETARDGHLGAFRNEVDAKTGNEPGKAFTVEEGAILKQLSTEL
jgi:hypothetical protein